MFVKKLFDEDPSSADNFESKEGSLNNLKLKILSKSMDFSIEEVEFHDHRV